MKKVLLLGFFLINAGALDIHAAAVPTVETNVGVSTAETDSDINSEVKEEVVATTMSQKMQGALLGVGTGFVFSGVAGCAIDALMSVLSNDRFDRNLKLCLGLLIWGEQMAMALPIMYIHFKLADEIEMTKYRESLLSFENFLGSYRGGWQDRNTTEKISFGTFMGTFLLHRMYMFHRMMVSMQAQRG